MKLSGSHLQVFLAAVILFPLFPCCGFAQAQTLAPKPGLSVHLELRSSAPPAGNVLLRNDGIATIRVWQRDNSWGDSAVTFLLQRGTGVQKFSEKFHEYSANVPGYITLAPGQTQNIPFDLSGSGDWEPAWQPGTSASGGTLTAVYSVAPTKESVEFNVWTGEIASAPVKLD